MPACSRRRFLAAAAVAAAAVRPTSTVVAAGGPAPLRYPVGVCDWMILERQKLGAFKLAAEIGADGAVREQFLGEAATRGLRICQIHASNEDGRTLEHDPQIDLPAVRKTLDDLGWRGWLVIERSRDAADGRNVAGNFGANARHLKRIFQNDCPLPDTRRPTRTRGDRGTGNAEPQDHAASGRRQVRSR